MSNYRLVVCEKPSVAKSIAAVLDAKKREDGFLMGNGFIVSWCFGHLAELADADAYDEKYGKWRREDLPILPETWQYTVARDKKKQLDLLRTLMNRDDVSEVINACDAGREGELIFRTVYCLNKCRKPMKRLWISSMEDAAILSGFENLKDGSEYDSLYASALCRSKADWLVGINATRLFSVMYHRTLNVGRVVSPTLALLVQREAEISAFQPEAFYSVHIGFGDFSAAGERVNDKSEAQKLAESCKGQSAAVTSVTETEKTENFIGSYRAVRKLSDLICAEHRLSVIENPQKHGLSYNKWLGGHDKLSNRDLLRMAIDAALEKKPKDFDALLALLKSSGYTVTRKGRLSLRHENQKKSIRLDSLGEGYSEQELRAVLAGGKTHNPFVKKKYPKRKERTTLISKIEAKLNSGKGYWYDQKMKVVKLKQMAKTFVYLEEQGFADFAALSNAAAAAEERFSELKATIKAEETRISEIQTLRTHIINYSKTREVYAGYRKAGYSKKYLAEHESDIILHKAAKKVFDVFGLKKLPTVKSLNEEFARLLTEKKAAYADYHKTQEQMRELLIHKANAAYLLGLEERKQQIAERQQEENSDGTSRSHR